MTLIDLRQVKDLQASLVLLERRIRRDTGLNLNQAFVLCCLKKGSCRIGDLSSRLKIHGASLSRILKTLSLQGYLESTEESKDGRSRILVLTEKGTILGEKLLALEQKWFPWPVLEESSVRFG